MRFLLIGILILGSAQVFATERIAVSATEKLVCPEGLTCTLSFGDGINLLSKARASAHNQFLSQCSAPSSIAVGPFNEVEKIECSENARVASCTVKFESDCTLEYSGM